jgi:hypothetical protein
MDVSKNISDFIDSDGRTPGGRNASFDYCFNYFQSFRLSQNIGQIAAAERMEMSCLQLGFYLASWGMLRGSSFLLQRSSKHYEELILNISQFDTEVWNIDVDSYGDQHKRQLLLDCGDMIGKSLRKEKEVTDTLKTKIMLGVFGNTPAFDDYFPKGLGVGSFCHKSLKKIFDFYGAHKQKIEERSIHTLGFDTGQPTSRLYTRAKIIDMVGVQEGFAIAAKDKRLKELQASQSSNGTLATALDEK